MSLTGSDLRGFMILVTNRGAGRFAARAVCPAGFIPCISARDDDAAAQLAAALAKGDSKNVRSLRRNDEPDDTAWLRGSGWWLSTAETG